MSHFKAQLVQLLDHTYFKESNISFSADYYGSSKYKAQHDKPKGSIICNKYHPKPQNLNDSLLFISNNSKYNKTISVTKGHTNRTNNKKRKDYHKILTNGSMKDIHSENYNYINLPLQSIRIEKSISRKNSIKIYLNNYKQEISINANRPISFIKTHKKINDSFNKDITLASSKSFLTCSLPKSYKTTDSFIESIGRNQDKNIDNHHKKKSFLQKHNPIPFKKIKNFNRLFYTSEIDAYSRGFASCEKE